MVECCSAIVGNCRARLPVVADRLQPVSELKPRSPQRDGGRTIGPSDIDQTKSTQRTIAFTHSQRTARSS
ncbi:hypothetical protein AJ87_45045 [Rhizobium yanglingense]|nr:hypothetical protein AJ87_45045 [Rhizobium yanglingense]